jgi:hypothetical protein
LSKPYSFWAGAGSGRQSSRASGRQRRVQDIGGSR